MYGSRSCRRMARGRDERYDYMPRMQWRRQRNMYEPGSWLYWSIIVSRYRPNRMLLAHLVLRCAWPGHVKCFGTRSFDATSAEVLTTLLLENGRQLTVLEGDLRTHLLRCLGISKEDRDSNIRRFGFAVSEIVRLCGVVICATFRPYCARRATTYAIWLGKIDSSMYS